MFYARIFMLLGLLPFLSSFSSACESEHRCACLDILQLDQALSKIRSHHGIRDKIVNRKLRHTEREQIKALAIDVISYRSQQASEIGHFPHLKAFLEKAQGQSKELVHEFEDKYGFEELQALSPDSNVGNRYRSQVALSNKLNSDQGTAFVVDLLYKMISRKILGWYACESWYDARLRDRSAWDQLVFSIAYVPDNYDTFLYAISIGKSQFEILWGS